MHRTSTPIHRLATLLASFSLILLAACPAHAQEPSHQAAIPELRDIDPAKCMTNLPLDSTYMMQEMINYKKGETCGYSSIFWSDLTSHFVGDTIKTIRTWVPRGSKGKVNFWILDESNGDLLWDCDLTDVPMEQMITIPCGFVLDEPKGYRGGLHVHLYRGHEQPTGCRSLFS